MVFCRRFVDPNNKKRELITPKKKKHSPCHIEPNPPPKKKKKNFVGKKSTLSSAVSQVSGTLDSHTSLLFICSSVCETCITCSLCWDNSSLANPRRAKWLLKKTCGTIGIEHKDSSSDSTIHPRNGPENIWKRFNTWNCHSGGKHPTYVYKVSQILEFQKHLNIPNIPFTLPTSRISAPNKKSPLTLIHLLVFCF